MAIYGISDLHLSLASDKPMDVFGDQWQDHHEQIRENWIRLVDDDDTILVPGDISWALTLDEAQTDLDYLMALPGQKIIIKGNHDYWWTSLQKVRQVLDDSVFALQNDSIIIEDNIAIAGSRGWICPNDRNFTAHDEKIYKREVQRLKLSLESAKNKNPREIWVIMHYMPTNDNHQHNDFIQLLQDYNVKKVIYGHLHGPGQAIKIDGRHWDIDFHLISCDYINFTPVKLD